MFRARLALPDGTIPKDMDSATRYAMNSVKRALAMAGADLREVSRCTVMLTDMSEWESFNRVYVTYFEPGRLPARSAIGGQCTRPGRAVEVECTAYTLRNGC
jgi:enamine deaminase RidA (YjgF/YER057c/UK114 family)